MLYIRIENFEEYKQAYTELASDKLLQTYGAIIKASLSETDYIGLLNENTFLIITDVLKAESVAKFLTYAFDSTISKFYSQQDFSRGYMILQGDEFAGKRADFAHFTISVITNENKKYSDSVEVLNTLEQLNNMANIPVKSNYLIDRIKISGAITEKEYNNKVLIYETDEALSLLLNTILNLQGYKTEIMEEFCLPKEYSEPALIIIDAGDLEKKNGLNLCYKLKQTQKYQNTKMIVTSIIHDKELILNTGADLYLPKPYEIPNLIKWVDTLVREFNR